MVSAKAVQLRALTRADYPALLRFLSGFEDEVRDESFWSKRLSLWWDLNPAFDETIPRGWIVSDENAVKGFFGNIPTRVQLAGNIVTAFNATTWRVAPECRNYSLSLFYQAVRAARDSIFFNTTPSDDVIKILDVYKFRLLPHAENSQKSVIVVNPKRLAESRVRGRFRSAVLALAGAPVAGALQILRLRFGQMPAGVEVRELAGADGVFDELWLRTRHLYANTNVRFAGAVQWQCFASPEFRKLLFGCFAGDRLAGYIIARARIREELNVLRAVDVWLDPDQPFALPSLLRFVQEWAAEHGLDMVEVPHFNTSLARQLAALGLLRRAASGEERGYYLAPRALEAAQSYFVALQGDYGL